MMDYKYKISVVIPVYKVEAYLRETVESVIAQTIGFEENIQLILVNDGSPDNSEEICLEYKKRYPRNVIYLKKENGGVSSARNEGIPYIEGKYVNFLDSDDRWSEDAFEKMTELFDENFGATDVVTARKRFFDGREGWHHLDYRFYRTRIADLRREYDMVQLDVTGALIKAEAIGNRRFSSMLKYGEDAVFVSSILLQKRTLGICREAVHLYRKRQDESSALQNELKSRSYYFDSPEYFHKELFRQSEDKYGRIEPFIQYTVMYDISWRVGKEVRDFLSEEDYQKYLDILTGLMKQIDDRVILKQKKLWKKQKVFCLLKKHGLDKAAEKYKKISKVKIVYQ